MKKFIVLILLAIVVVPFLGCDQEMSVDDIFRTAEAVRADIRIIVTDQEVKPLIPVRTLEQLATAETIFLQAKRIHDEMGNEDPNAVRLLVQAADGIISVLDELVLDGKYQREIAAARVAIKVLRNHL